MILFPKFLVVLLIYGALSLTAIAFISLIVMVVKDYLKKTIW